MNNIIDFPIIDLHTHLRDKVAFHSKKAKDAGISMIVCMPNTQPCLDNLDTINKYLSNKRYIDVIPTSAITIGRKGKKLVDIDNLKNRVLGFSDDGDCLNNLDLLSQALAKDILIMAHLEPELEMTKKYIKVLSKINTGRLHIQHVSKKETVDLIRNAKKQGLQITCETCPHYFTYESSIENKAVNPPLATEKDILAIREGLSDGTIDCIASDYAPIPRPKDTGFASFESFVWLSYGLVINGTLTKSQLKEKLYQNPLKIIRKNFQI